MKLLRQFLIILIICFIGEVLNKVVHVPLPGSIIGMILLFICLITGVIKLEKVDEISRFLIDHLAFFFYSGRGCPTWLRGCFKGKYPSYIGYMFCYNSCSYDCNRLDYTAD